jgi:hypothetical protein
MPLPKGSYYDATTGEEKIAETNNGNWFCCPLLDARYRLAGAV